MIRLTLVFSLLFYDGPSPVHNTNNRVGGTVEEDVYRESKTKPHGGGGTRFSTLNTPNELGVPRSLICVL